MASTSETVLQALHAALAAGLPAGVTLLRNAGLPARVPEAGMMILRDGDPGEPEFLFSPPLWIFEHRAEVDLIVEAGSDAERDALFDALKLALGTAIAADHSLGGLCDYVLGEAPAPLDLPIEGAEGLKAATIGVILTYGSADPLN